MRGRVCHQTQHISFLAHCKKQKKKRGVPHFGPFKSEVIVITKVDKDFSFFFIGLLKIPSCFIKHLLGPWSGSLITRYYYIIYQLLSKTSDGPKKNSFVKLVQQLSEEMIKSGPKGKNQLFEKYMHRISPLLLSSVWQNLWTSH